MTSGRLGRRSLLLDLDDAQPTYSSGRPPPLSDDDLMREYEEDYAERTYARPSVSYDDFVGRPPSMHPESLYLQSGRRGTYSQVSGLDNFQRYSDMDDFPDDGQSMHGYHSSGGTVGGRLQSGDGGRLRNRGRVMGTVGGLMSRAKSVLGMAPEYLEMDLPLTEAGVGSSSQSGTGTGDWSKGQRDKRFSWEKFKFGLGRGKAGPSNLGPRIIYLNNSPANSANKYINNHISTAKYRPMTFVPKLLFEQFSKYANLFFLFTGALQQIPGVSPSNRYGTFIPLMFVLLASIVRELTEEFKRRASDKSLNNSTTKVLKGSSFLSTKWIDVTVGDIVMVESEGPFPADLVLLASSEPEGLCFVETANLDGETNHKIKQAIPDTAAFVSPYDLSGLGGRLCSEQPNSSLYTYEATLTMAAEGGEKTIPVASDQLLLRGATLRNTTWIYGVVVFTGHDTKLMKSATIIPTKRSTIDRLVDKQVLVFVGILIGISFISSIGAYRTNTASSKFQYLFYPNSHAAKQFFSDILTYWVLYSNLVPVSLFFTLEFIKSCQASFINYDLDIYHDKTDTPAACQTSSLVEELGRVEHIFSDKTGTLTCNKMEFRECSIAGIRYTDEIPEDRGQGDVDVEVQNLNQLRENLKVHSTKDMIHHFLFIWAACHTVIPKWKSEKPSDIKYHAISPDEGALVEGAVQFGYQFMARKPRSVTVNINGRDDEYELLAICEFNSTRKRMSTIFRCPDGKVRLYCKGADTVILERLAAPSNSIAEVTLQHLDEYALHGLRTLCLAMREIPEQEYQQWSHIFEKANTTVSGNRAEELDKVAELIEHDLCLLGATAIEDRLQDGVPETIRVLQRAKIKIWMLTGDRQETAINIGLSSGMIDEEMTLVIVNEESLEATRNNILKKLHAIRSQQTHGIDLEELGLVIDGRSLTYALKKDMEELFLDLVVLCKTVICW
jgi:phospholipid-transporting ATPase